MKFKNYDRKYERVFSGDELIKKKCDLDKVSVFGDEYNVTQYINMMKELTGGYDAMVFDFLVKYKWLTKKFCYSGRHRKHTSRNGSITDRAFGVFMRHHVGFDNRMVLYSTNWYGKITGYFDEFFPFFDIGNPFKDKYEYPFEYMNLACLFFVYQMDERMDLLRHGEQKKMNYTEFYDYVLNYISCFNEEHLDNYYTFIYSNRIAPYIKNKDYGKT